MTSVLTDQGHDMNPPWGAPRIHGELLKFSINVGLTSVAMYMARHRRLPSQGWKKFPRNHADGIASIDQCSDTLVSTALRRCSFYATASAKSLWLGVTADPAVEWIARKLTE